MATATLTRERPTNWRDWLKNPTVATIAAIVYIVVATLLVRAIPRSSLWYPLLSILVVPVFLLSPLIIISSNIRGLIKGILLAVMLLVIMPAIGVYNPSWLELAIQISVFAGLALGLNIVVGFAGLLDLGYVAFFALGAYLWGMFTSPADTVFTVNGWIAPNAITLFTIGDFAFTLGTFYLFMFVGVIAAALAGVLLGLPVLRLRGDYLAIVTLGFGEIIRVIARNLDAPINLTNGSQGLHNIGNPPLPPILNDYTTTVAGLFNFSVSNVAPVSRQLLFYLIAIAVLFLVVIVARRLQESPIGRAWTAIREDEVAAIAMGVPLVRMKLLAFATGASFAGAIGALYAAKQTFIDPSSFVLVQSISILAMVIVGGLGSIKGVVLGALVVTLLDLHILTNLSLQLNNLRNIDAVVPIINFPIRNWPTQLEPAKYQPLVFGLILVLMMLFRPAGLLPEARRKMELQQPEEPVVDEDPVLQSATPEKKELG